MIESLRLNMMPIFLTSLTTAIGFMTLNFSDVPPFHDLGNISAAGVLFAWIYAVLFLPALMMVLPIRVKHQERDASTVVMDRFAEWVISKQRLLILTMSAIVIVLVSLIPINEANDVYVKYFDESIQFRTDTDYVVDNLTGMYFVDFSLDTNESSGISEPKILQQIEKLANWLREQPEVMHVNTITDVFKRLNRSMHGDEDGWYKLPEEKDLAAQYLLLYEMSLPYGLDLNNQIDIDKRATRMTATLQTLSTTQVLELEERIHNWMETNTPDIVTWGSSPTVMFSHIGMTNIKSMMIGAVVALVIISMIMIFALRSWRYGVLSLIPNLVPAGMAFGIWAIIDGEIGMSISVVTAMTLGIVVDDSVHYLSKYLRARREQGLSATDSVRYAFHTVGIALWVTSIALVAGFLVLTMSAFELNSSMGLLVSIIIALALIADFLLLPPLLIKLDGWLNPTDSTPVKEKKPELSSPGVATAYEN
jgi:predicted RND superfamily exporter protein